MPLKKIILELARTEEHPLHACLHLIAYAGLRRGEALGLKWRNTDLVAGSISVVETLGRSHHQGLIFQAPKTKAGRRVVDLDARTVEVLREHQGQQLLGKMQAEGAYQDRDLVFADNLGRPLDPMGVTRGFQALAKRQGMAHIRLHDLRHFNASVMLQSGQNPALVSRRLGHADITTTMNLYVHVMPGYGKQAADAFARAMEQG